MALTNLKTTQDGHTALKMSWWLFTHHTVKDLPAPHRDPKSSTHLLGGHRGDRELIEGERSLFLIHTKLL